MQWLIQNWIPLAVGITFLILIRRGGMCCSHRQAHHPDAGGEIDAFGDSTKTSNPQVRDKPPAARSGP